MTIVIDTDLREKLGDARDQRQRPTCLVFAASAAHEASRTTSDYLSAEFLFYSGAQRSHNDPARGLTEAALAEALQHDGQWDEAAWPYLLETPETKNWKPPAFATSAHRAVLEFSPRTTTQVRKVLNAGKPVLLVLALTLAMYAPDEHGVVRARTTDTVTTRRHAVLAVGSGHADDGEYILIRNSWGPGWGQSGHGWLQTTYLTPQLQTTGVIS